jgi:hypothetical protein
MSGRFARSWELVKASGSVLKEDKGLLVFPLISSIAMLGIVAAFAIPMFTTGAIDGLVRSGGDLSIGHYAIAFLFYVIQYFVAFFFNAALVGAAMIRLDGGRPTLVDGLSIARSKAWSILGYALIAATVGMILRAIEERIGFIGRIIVGFIGIAWSLATFLVVPVLVARDVGPAEALTESASLLKRTWGESVIGQGGMGFVFAMIYLAVAAGGISLFAVGVIANSWTLSIAAVATVVVFMLAAMLVHSALSAIYAAALYRYATGEGSTGAFGAPMLAAAFRPK